jgi:hypothetical protein
MWPRDEEFTSVNGTRSELGTLFTVSDHVGFVFGVNRYGLQKLLDTDRGDADVDMDTGLESNGYDETALGFGAGVFCCLSLWLLCFYVRSLQVWAWMAQPARRLRRC